MGSAGASRDFSALVRRTIALPGVSIPAALVRELEDRLAQVELLEATRERGFRPETDDQLLQLQEAVLGILVSAPVEDGDEIGWLDRLVQLGDAIAGLRIREMRSMAQAAADNGEKVTERRIQQLLADLRRRRERQTPDV